MILICMELSDVKPVSTRSNFDVSNRRDHYLYSRSIRRKISIIGLVFFIALTIMYGPACSDAFQNLASTTLRSCRIPGKGGRGISLRYHNLNLQHSNKDCIFSTRLLSTTQPLSTKTSSITNAVALKHTEFAIPKGPESKSPAIFLHGLLGNKRNFATIGRSLAAQLQHQRRIVGLDLRNHGDNHHDWRDDMNYRSMAADVLHFLDQNNIERAELIGHSVGGKVAQAVALMEPDRVDGLVVIDIAPVKYTDDEPHWKAVTEIIDALSSTELQPGMSKRDVDKQLQSAVPDPALRAFCLTNYDQTCGEWKVHLNSIASQLESLAGFDIDRERQYTGDAFFIHGGQSKFVRHKHMDAIAKHFPNHMLTTIRGAGHWVHAEAPEDTTVLLKRFLDR